MVRMEARPPALNAVGWMGRTLRSEVWIGIEPLHVALGWFRDREPGGRWEVIAVDVSPTAVARRANRLLGDRADKCEGNAIIAVDGVIPEDGGQWMFQGSVGSCATYVDIQDTLSQPRGGLALPDFDGLRRAVDAHLSVTFTTELHLIAPHAAAQSWKRGCEARRATIDPYRS